MKISISNYQSYFLIFIFLPIFLLSCKKEEQKITSTPVLTEIKKDSLISPKIKSDDFHVFEIYPMENGKNYDIFISLSYIYTDSLAIPTEIIANQKNLSFNELKHFELPSAYRKKLLKGSKLEENDTLYIYNYKSNFLEKFAIKNLKAVANLSLYTSEVEEVSEYDYMIGFQLQKTENKDRAMDMVNFTLAYFGKQNPFNTKPLKEIIWKKITADQFPVKKQNYNLKPDNIYHYQTEDLQYFLQDLMRETEVVERKLTVLKNGKLIFEKDYTLGEGSAFVPLNGISDTDYPRYQWTGNLFKGKPPVIFGFVSQSFGCSSIEFLEKNYREIYTNCDNRH